METIAIVDTSLCTDNLGDEIIMDAVNEIVWDLFPTAYIFRVPSHESLSDRTRAFLRKANWCFVGGTNLLSSNLTPNGLWRVRSEESRIFGSTRTVCLGTGWNDYMAPPNPRTRTFLRNALSQSLLHSARDSYTRDHLLSIGIDAVTTSCPTTWSLTPGHCLTIPRKKAPSVVFTLSAWRPDPQADRAFVEILRRHYPTVHFFPQMQDDCEYFNSFGWSDIKIVAPTLEKYNKFLEYENVDFVGTRLHGGIRAMQKGRRALILAIDNRAAELAKDTNLPVYQRTDQAGIESWIEGAVPTEIHLPQKVIDSWKAQFTALNRSATPMPPTQFDLEASRLRRTVRSMKRGIRLGLGLS